MPTHDDDNCPNCGMPVSSGDEPTIAGGQMYCCQGCASGGDCTCAAHNH